VNTSDRGKALIKSFEHCVLEAYPDPASGGEPWTCGWGSTRGVGPDTVWTPSQADAAFEVDVAEAERLVNRFVTHAMTQGQFDAFVSIFYNVGPGNSTRDGIAYLRSGRPSTLLRKFNEGDIAGCENEWLKWISPNNPRVTRGLLRRRMAELELFRA
jgi:lysozyme